MTAEDEISLRDAIARNKGAVLSLPLDTSLKHCKSRFVAECDNGLLLEAPDHHHADLVQSAIQSQAECYVCFKKGFDKLAFATQILEARPQWPLSESAKVDALLLPFPAELMTLQRRRHYRARVPADFELKVRIWTIEEWAYISDVPPRTQEINCELRDLSVGGMGVRLIGKDGQPPLAIPANRLRIQLDFEGETTVLEARMREPFVDPKNRNRIVTGLNFKKLEANFEGRQTLALLTRIVGELQRLDLHRTRAGVPDVVQDADLKSEICESGG